MGVMGIMGTMFLIIRITYSGAVRHPSPRENIIDSGFNSVGTQGLRQEGI
jgi:hypothetical protein